MVDHQSSQSQHDLSSIEDRSLVVARKKEWCRAENQRRMQLGLCGRLPMRKKVDPWQEWRVHPRGTPVLVDGKASSLEKAYLKLSPADSPAKTPEDIRRAIRPGHAVVVSSAVVTVQKRAWLCRLHGLKHLGELSIPAVAKAGPSDNKQERICQTFELRSLAIEDKENPELLAYDGDLGDRYRRGIRAELEKLLRGDYQDPDAPPPGSIVRCTTPLSSFDAFVVTSCRVWNRTRDARKAESNPVLTCQLIDFAKEHEQSPRILVPLRKEDGCELADPPASIAIILVRPVPRAYLSRIGMAEEHVPKVRASILDLAARF